MAAATLARRIGRSGAPGPCPDRSLQRARHVPEPPLPLCVSRVFHVSLCRGLGCPYILPEWVGLSPCSALSMQSGFGERTLHLCGCAVPVLTYLCPPGVLPLCCRPPAWDRPTRPPPSPLQPPGLPLAPCRSFSNNKIQVELDESSGTAGCTSVVSPPSHGHCGTQAGSLPPTPVPWFCGSGHGKSPKPQM